MVMCLLYTAKRGSDYRVNEAEKEPKPRGQRIKEEEDGTHRGGGGSEAWERAQQEPKQWGS